MKPNASVIICTCDRPGGLARALRSVIADPSSLPRELVVVDNGGEHNAAAVNVELEAARQRANFPVRGYRQPRRGKSHALNLALSQAHGDVLLFTDDDVEVEAGWADALAAPFADPGVGLVMGRTLAAWPGPPPRWVSDSVARALGVRDLGDGAGPAVPGDVIGANMAVRTSALAEGPVRFDDGLGPRGQLKVDYEEVVLAEAISRTHSLGYAPAALVRHHIDPARLDVEWMRRMSFQRGFGWAAHDRKIGAEVPLAIALCRAAFYYPRTFTLRLRHADSHFGAAEADREFEGFRAAGRYLGRLLYRWPGLADWAAGHLA